MAFEDFIKAGKISREALEYGKTLVVKGAKPLDICNKIEKKIFELGGEIAFPAQISLNEVAAHYCPEDDNSIVLSDEICCLDVGVQVNGAIGDNAMTVDLSGKNTDLVKASAEALKAAAEILSVGVELRKVGKVIEDTIHNFGFNPIKNLSGHGIGVYEVHKRPTVPNFDNGDATKLQKGMTIAIEPFATTGVGAIYESEKGTIFALNCRKPVRSAYARQALKIIEKYNGLPFCSRWLMTEMSPGQAKFAIRELLQNEMLEEFPPLPERTHKPVSQAEHSVLVLKDGCEVLTKV